MLYDPSGQVGTESRENELDRVNPARRVNDIISSEGGSERTRWSYRSRGP